MSEIITPRIDTRRAPVRSTSGQKFDSEKRGAIASIDWLTAVASTEVAAALRGSGVQRVCVRSRFAALVAARLAA